MTSCMLAGAMDGNSSVGAEVGLGVIHVTEPPFALAHRTLDSNTKDATIAFDSCFIMIIFYGCFSAA